MNRFNYVDIKQYTYYYSIAKKNIIAYKTFIENGRYSYLLFLIIGIIMVFLLLIDLYIFLFYLNKNISAVRDIQQTASWTKFIKLQL